MGKYRQNHTFCEFVMDYCSTGVFIGMAVWIVIVGLCALKGCADSDNYEKVRPFYGALLGVQTDNDVIWPKIPADIRTHLRSAEHRQAILTSAALLSDKDHSVVAFSKLTGAWSDKSLAPATLKHLVSPEHRRATMAVPYYYGTFPGSIKDDLAVIVESAKKGRMKLGIDPWDEYRQSMETFWFKYMLGIALYIGCMGGYIWMSVQNHEKLLDLPWHKPWAWLFFLLSLPICSPFYLISLIRLAINSLAEARKDELQRQEVAAADNIVPAGHRSDVSSQSGADVDEDTEYAKLLDSWKKIRVAHPHEQWQGELKDALRKETDAREKLMRLGSQIKDLQIALNQARSAAQEIRENEPPTDHAAPVWNCLENELLKIFSLAVVKDVKIENGTIIITTAKIIYPLSGVLFDLGSYEVGFRRSGIYVKCIRQTSNAGTSPLFYGGHGSFCFGERTPEINHLLSYGEYLPAIILALECIQYVNPDKIAAIPLTYPRMSP